MSFTTRKTAHQPAIQTPANPSSGDGAATIGSTTVRNFNPLQAGETQFYSYLEPDLQCDDEIVSTLQKIRVDGQVGKMSDEQELSVKTPRYKLPDDAMESFYPPSGGGAPVETLPHIVFKDPYLAWERPVSTHIETTSVYKVPWMALIAFTEDELRLEPNELEGDTGLFRNFTAESNKLAPRIEQDANLAVQMPLDQVLNLAYCRTPVEVAGHDTSKETSLSAIFLKPSLFNELFRNQGINDGDQRFPDLSRYGYLSHVRQINAEGMPEAGVERFAHHSIVLSHRTGPVNQKNPTPVVVHLVSLEGIENMEWPIPDSAKFVAMPSLYSWTYMCHPPGAFDVERMIRDLGTTRGPLRSTLPWSSTIDVRDNPSSEGQMLAKRFSDGYTLTRHRTKIGEITTALVRGALTPTFVARHILEDLSKNSDCGTDLGIWDREAGLVDITYSVAWQLGKTLAIADREFCISLTRLRSQIHAEAMNQAKANISTRKDAFVPKDEAINATADIMEALDQLQCNGPNTEIGQRRLMDRWKMDRWNGEVKDPVDSSPNRKLDTRYTGARRMAEEFETSADPDNDDIYDKLNQPTSSEWQLVLSWVLDKMFLSGIPFQYLVVDQAYLPPESLRFFHIDPNWMDAFLDGALSLGNHLTTPFDKVRLTIKRLINNYITAPLPTTNQPPPIPSYGFFIRSDVVTHIPDLRVTAEFEPPRVDLNVKSIMRQVLLADGVLMCLVDTSPLSNVPSRLTGLRFTLSPHQLSFEVGTHLDGQSLSTRYMRLSTSPDGSNRPDALCPDYTLTFDEPLKDKGSSIFAWGANNEIRSLQFPAWSNKLLGNLETHMPGKDKDLTSEVMTSALVGMQLTKPTVEIFISVDEESRVPYTTN
ncbi:hypothetical protein BP6252_13219 [Coleophoma cylindrospora]|uniref:Uncharacterized protein n=1 Tax=Coleophoma cylindrospora TaxID=1849047 RepID=A0A3D8QA73_9HELO|nr:hypothetical protein BP6252_13219 [Coleophoma cylindrospora]